MQAQEEGVHKVPREPRGSAREPGTRVCNGFVCIKIWEYLTVFSFPIDRTRP